MWYKLSKIYVGTNQVRPEKWREPWANTVAWYPLNNTTKNADMSWHNYNLTENYTPTYTGINWVEALKTWANLWYLTSSSVPIPYANQARTISAWAYSHAYSSTYNYWFILSYGWPDATKYWMDAQPTRYWNSYEFEFGTGAGSNIVDWANTLNVWKLHTTVVTWSAALYYVDGVLVWSQAKTLSTDSTSSRQFCIGSYNVSPTTNDYRWRFYISNVVIERVARSADDVANYYKLTKKQYWL